MLSSGSRLFSELFIGFMNGVLKGRLVGSSWWWCRVFFRVCFLVFRLFSCWVINCRCVESCWMCLVKVLLECLSLFWDVFSWVSLVSFLGFLVVSVWVWWKFFRVFCVFSMFWYSFFVWVLFVVWLVVMFCWVLSCFSFFFRCFFWLCRVVWLVRVCNVGGLMCDRLMFSLGVLKCLFLKWLRMVLMFFI